MLEVLQSANGPDKENPPATMNITNAQATDRYCNENGKDVGKLGSVFTYDLNEILLKQSKEDGALQKFIPATV